MEPSPTDETLMLDYARGDMGAFETLYARHRSGLFRFLMGNVRNKATAEELFQDIWQRVVGARDRYRPDARFSTWLYQIAHHRLTDHWRRARHRPEAPEDADERIQRVSDPIGPDGRLSEFEERRRLQRALETLPPEQREAVLLRLEQEYSLEEIAEMTGVGRETVKSRLRYAMDKLRARLQE